VPSFIGHKLALLVAATSQDANVNLETYRQLSDMIAKTYGDISSYHPSRAGRMRLSFGPGELGHEWRVRSSRRGLAGWLKYFARDAAAQPGRHLPLRAQDGHEYRPLESLRRGHGRKLRFPQLRRHAAHGDGRQCSPIRRPAKVSRRAAPPGTAGLQHAQITRSAGDSDGGYAMAARGLKAQLKAALAG
jgi:hypothetical protein